MLAILLSNEFDPLVWAEIKVDCQFTLFFIVSATPYISDEI